ncbi:MAG: TlpA family protein disulfide reductase [Bernardetiaceae bacterium]|nr:TlpA family protein disulfide reductase [Bernardetiaceae bacterium]
MIFKYFSVSLIYFIAFIAIAMGQGNTVLQGQLLTLEPTNAYFRFYEDPITLFPLEYKLPSDANGAFNSTLEIQKNTALGEWIYQSESYPIFIHKGDSLFIHFDEQSDEIYFSGIGANENNCLNEFKKRFWENPKYIGYPDKMQKYKPKEFRSFIDKRQKEQFKFFEQYQKTTPLSNAFMRFISQSIYYQNAGDLLVYPLLNPNIYAEDFLDEDYYVLLSEIPLSDSMALDNPFYVDFVRKYWDYRYRKSFPQFSSSMRPNYYDSIWNWVGREWHAPVAEFVRSLYIAEILRQTGGNLKNTDYQNFTTIKSNPLYEPLQNLKAQYKKLEQGKGAPSFNLIDTSGQTYSLKNFEGKVVYLEFWASHSPASLQEVDFANRLQEDFSKDEFAYIKISLDESLIDWERAIKKYKIQGLHLNDSGAFSPTARLYAVTQTPTYFLIDKNGNIVKSFAKRPSQVGIKEDIERLLLTR